MSQEYVSDLLNRVMKKLERVETNMQVDFLKRPESLQSMTGAGKNLLMKAPESIKNNEELTKYKSKKNILKGKKKESKVFKNMPSDLNLDGIAEMEEDDRDEFEDLLEDDEEAEKSDDQETSKQTNDFFKDYNKIQSLKPNLVRRSSKNNKSKLSWMEKSVDAKLDNTFDEEKEEVSNKNITSSVPNFSNQVPVVPMLTNNVPSVPVLISKVPSVPVMINKVPNVPTVNKSLSNQNLTTISALGNNTEVKNAPKQENKFARMQSASIGDRDNLLEQLKSPNPLARLKKTVTIDKTKIDCLFVKRQA